MAETNILLEPETLQPVKHSAFLQKPECLRCGDDGNRTNPRLPTPGRWSKLRRKAECFAAEVSFAGRGAAGDRCRRPHRSAACARSAAADDDVPAWALDYSEGR